MKVLFDHNIPVQLARLLRGHEVTSAKDLAWDTLRNGDLLAAAQQTGFSVMLTADQSIFYQQNNSLRRIALVVTSTNYRPSLERNVAMIQTALDRSSVGSFELVTIASRP